MDKRDIQAKAEMDKRDAQARCDKLEAKAEMDKRGIQDKAETDKRDAQAGCDKLEALLEKKEAQARCDKLEVEMDKREIQAKAEMDKRDAQVRCDKLEAEMDKRGIQANAEMDKRDAKARCDKLEAALENEKKDRLVQQQQMDRLKWEARPTAGQMPQLVYGSAPTAAPSYIVQNTLPAVGILQCSHQLNLYPWHHHCNPHYLDWKACNSQLSKLRVQQIR
jgi:hypothetical protein